jgi:ribosomal protein S21
MIRVTKKDTRESLESLLRRFNRKVQQSGNVAVVKQKQFFEKPISKIERRRKAIIRQQRKSTKFNKIIKLGPKF